ncbi:MurR/RpiR family transcriptional regulator [Carnobacterium sp.]|uniref:MurR/RpiR family transcriptional regulator n=1 Tax=Carnobacterium sp. TaxID=48221 RepID=UPI003C791E09
MDILEEIQKQFVYFSLKEKKVATYILKKGKEIKNMNITELAKVTETSTSTITRFCKKINCENFVDMKIKISSIYQEENKNHGLNIFDDVYSFYDKVIKNTIKNMNREKIEEVVALIKTAHRIFIYGVGSSGLTAIEMTQRLLRMGLNVSSITDSHMMLINSSVATEKDLVIGISTSGNTQEVVDALRMSKKNHGTIVSITSLSNSAITKTSDISLYVYNSSFVDDQRFVNSQFAIIYLMDVISMMLLADQTLNYKMNKTIEAILKDKEE